MSIFQHPNHFIPLTKQGIIEQSKHCSFDDKVIIVGSSGSLATGNFNFDINVKNLYFATSAFATTMTTKALSWQGHTGGIGLTEIGRKIRLSGIFHLTQAANINDIPTFDQAVSGEVSLRGFLDDGRPATTFTVQSGCKFSLGGSLTRGSSLGCFNKNTINASAAETLTIDEGAQIFGKVYFPSHTVIFPGSRIGAEVVFPNAACEVGLPRISWMGATDFTLTYPDGKKEVEDSHFSMVPYLRDTFFSGGGTSINFLGNDDDTKKFVNIALASIDKGTLSGDIYTTTPEGKITKFT